MAPKQVPKNAYDLSCKHRMVDMTVFCAYYFNMRKLSNDTNIIDETIVMLNANAPAREDHVLMLEPDQQHLRLVIPVHACPCLGFLLGILGC